MNFSAASSIRFGWETFKKRPGFFIGITAIMLVASWLIGALAGALTAQGSAASVLGTLVNLGLSTLLSMGFAAALLKAHAAVESAEIRDLWHPQPFLKFLGGELLAGVIILIGFVLLIIPGIFAILTFLFVPYIVVDKQLNPVEALKESARLAKGSRWEILLLVLFVFGLNVLGAIALLVGLLVSIPVTTLALVHAYRSLEAKTRA